MNATVLRPELTEAQFQTWVLAVARWNGWKIQHTRPAQYSSGRWATPIQGDAGFPDLVLAHPTRGVIFAELKRQSGRLSTSQTEWMMLLQGGAEAYVWRPSDSKFIAHRLRGVA